MMNAINGYRPEESRTSGENCLDGRSRRWSRQSVEARVGVGSPSSTASRRKPSSRPSSAAPNLGPSRPGPGSVVRMWQPRSHTAMVRSRSALKVSWPPWSRCRASSPRSSGASNDLGARVADGELEPVRTAAVALTTAVSHVIRGCRSPSPDRTTRDSQRQLWPPAQAPIIPAHHHRGGRGTEC
jgi:hypothetical protein